MKLIFSVFLILACTNCFSQKLVSSQLLPCYAFGEVIFKERIASQRFSYDTLYLEINLSANCAAQFKSTLKSTNDSLFIELKNISEIYDACDCCYTMLFTITEMQDSIFKLFIDQQEFRFSKSKYIDVPPRNIPKELFKNELTKDGLKVGYWKIKGQNGNYYNVFYGNDPNQDDNPLWVKSFNKKGELTSISVRAGKPTDHYSINVNLRKYEEILNETIMEEQTTK
ncbi:hypothetical protein [Fluviicola taffensis]|uniref:hypothetical protein n=1 Tax=Fluviicola taffensis TaxID=191579 RepID=UPI003137B186